MAADTIDIWDSYFGSKQTILQLEYSGDNVIYEGKAMVGTATSASGWMIRKYTYDGDNVTQRNWAPFNSIWDNRASLTYS